MTTEQKYKPLCFRSKKMKWPQDLNDLLYNLIMEISITEDVHCEGSVSSSELTEALINW